jgi:hypothetical protein
MALTSFVINKSHPSLKKIKSALSPTHINSISQHYTHQQNNSLRQDELSQQQRAQLGQKHEHEPLHRGYS